MTGNAFRLCIYLLREDNGMSRLAKSHAELIGALDTLIQAEGDISVVEMVAIERLIQHAKQLQEERNDTEGFDEFSAMPNNCNLCGQAVNGEDGDNHVECEDREAYLSSR